MVRDFYKEVFCKAAFYKVAFYKGAFYKIVFYKVIFLWTGDEPDFCRVYIGAIAVVFRQRTAIKNC